MKKSENVFQRYEKKYVCTTSQYRQLLEKMKPYMQMDIYGHQVVCNIYYDTDSYELIRKSIDKPFYKEKIRLRSYGIPKLQTETFLELKKKVNGIVYKRRTGLPYVQAAEYIRHKKKESGDQVCREIDWFCSRYSLQPKLFLAYNRVSYVGKEDPELRMTFDDHIRYRREHLDLSYGDQGELITEEDQMILEIKIQYAMPIWLTQALSACKIYPCSYSKYGMCYQKRIFPEVYHV